MAHRNDELELAWKALSGSAPSAGWQAIPISSPSGCLLRAGRHSPGNEEVVMAGFTEGEIPPAQKLPEGHGFSVERADLEGGVQWLALARKPAGSLDLFSEMALDVIDAVEAAGGSTDKAAANAFLGRVRAWQEFMRRGAQALSPEQEIGLLGELTVLSAIMDAGVAPELAMRAWVGPEDANQDFEIGTGAIEAKATISQTGFPARISSLGQLDDAALQPLFVAGVRLAQTPSGKTLPEAIDLIRQSISGNQEALRLFKDKVFEAGYHPAHADGYARKFAAHPPRAVEVAKGFPRLTHGTVPIGITEAKYTIEMDAALRQGVDIAAALKKLGAI